MKLLLIRKYKKAEYTIGELYIDGKFFCNTIEDKDRGLKQDMTLSEIQKTKVPNETAIPAGKYEVVLDIISPSFSKKQFYKDFCDGKLPRLLNVPGFEGILIHCGTNQDNSSGCIIVGENKIKGGLINSKETFMKLYTILKSSDDKIEITIE